MEGTDNIVKCIAIFIIVLKFPKDRLNSFSLVICSFSFERLYNISKVLSENLRSPDEFNAIVLSKKTITILKKIYSGHFFYNVIGIPFAMGVFYIFGGPLLNPMLAGAAMSFSSISVVLNALRLKRVKLN